MNLKIISSQHSKIRSANLGHPSAPPIRSVTIFVIPEPMCRPTAFCNRGIASRHSSLNDLLIFPSTEMIFSPAFFTNISTSAEKKVWEGLLKERPAGYKFLRQKPIGNYILDFYCSELLFAVEIDGEIHESRKEYDSQRDNFLDKCGIRVIRVTNNEVENNFEEVKKNILLLIASASPNSDLPLSRGTEGVGSKVFKLRESNFKIWRSKIETEAELVEQLQQHLEPLDEHAKTEDVLYELLLKSGIPLTAKIEDKGGYYLVNDSEIALMLEKVNESIIKKIAWEAVHSLTGQVFKATVTFSTL